MINLQEWKEHPEKSFRIIAFGSSNTELTWSSAGRHNWVDWLGISLRAHIGKHVCMINQGIGGETSGDLLMRLERDVLSFQPSAVIITVGGNDAAKGKSTKEYIDNIRTVCEAVRRVHAEPVLHSYYCPIHHLHNEGFKASFEKIVEANRKLSAEMGMTHLDTYSRFEPFYRNEPEQYGRLMRDRLHVNYLGNLLMGMHLCEELQLPELQIPQDLKEEARFLWERMNRWYGKSY
ncbi:hypothetical protein PAESOLCIP111_01120 [Paenibacillus solanacearum]|uniref:SGNH hydrolase-type esterase domain-containing protein n=1 Tax=Paenibacillus solanacearum TaxID=2048548 RepID=A0A916JZC7_9BACL|nr:GDSL-type esterase/lipase family protein [Paenibacillus solanacearum]CAG7608991.1 hypothetical protein PAESOLCIP111_01120 [Paenibacillus solanacearum]